MDIEELLRIAVEDEERQISAKQLHNARADFVHRLESLRWNETAGTFEPLALADYSSELNRIVRHLLQKSGETMDAILSWVKQPEIDPLPAVLGGGGTEVRRGIPIFASLLHASDSPISIPAWFDAGSGRLSCPTDPSLASGGAMRLTEDCIEVVGSALLPDWHLFAVEIDSGPSIGNVEVFALRRIGNVVIRLRPPKRTSPA